MRRLFRIIGIACALAGSAACGGGFSLGGGGDKGGEDHSQEYRDFVKVHRNTFNLLASAERSKGEDLPLQIGMSDAMSVAEAYAEREELAPFVEACKAGKYENANEPALPPERGCYLASNAGELLADYLNRIVAANVKGATGNARASLDQLRQTGCAASFENFYAISTPGPEQERLAKEVPEVYAKAGLEPPAMAGEDLSKELDEAVAAAIAASKPSKPAKAEPATHKLIVAHFTKLCAEGVSGRPARNCKALKAWMTTSQWEMFNNDDGTPRRRTKEAKVLLRLADRDHCLLQHVVVAQDYEGDKFGASEAEVGSSACPVACK